MSLADVMERADDPALQQAHEALSGVRVDVATHVLAVAVITMWRVIPAIVRLPLGTFGPC